MPANATDIMKLIADAFPRVKGSMSTKQNWVFRTHETLSSLVPDKILPPQKYKTATSNGVFVITDRPRTIGFLSMPFLSDVAYMLASDIPNRETRAKNCVDEAVKSMGLKRVCFLLERALVTVLHGMSTITPDETAKRLFPPIMIAFSAAAIYAKLHLKTHYHGGVPFSWGEGDMAYIINDETEESLRPPLSARASFELLSILCTIQRGSAFSYMAMSRQVAATNSNHPGILISPTPTFIDTWGTGWLVWQLLTTSAQYNCGHGNVCKSYNEVIGKLQVLFPISFKLSQSLTRDILKSMPRVEKTSYEIRQEVLAQRKYTLWPGVTDVIWNEGGLRKLSILPTAPKGYIYTVMNCRVDLSDGKKEWADLGEVDLQFFVEIPPLTSDEEWETAKKNAEEVDPTIDERIDDLAVSMEAIRMCCVPTEQKVRQNRVPGGYVKSPPKKRADLPPDSAPISVTYVPRVTYVHPTAEGDDGDIRILREGSEGTGRHHRTHQVAGFIRQLGLEMKASDMARSNASLVGISLPPKGFTYVKPHMRGKGEDVDATETRKTVKVRR